MSSEIELINLDLLGLCLLLDHPDEYFKVHNALAQEDDKIIHGLAEQTLKFLQSQRKESRGLVFLVVDSDFRVIIGSCAFKTAPTPEGDVEIAYFVFPNHEGKGYGTAMACRLIEMASAEPRVRRIIAHTLPRHNASTRILQKTGFSFAGETTDPVDGLVWRWVIEKDD
jgi:RimJ/RimL family protein N-acetyltransferase